MRLTTESRTSNSAIFSTVVLAFNSTISASSALMVLLIFLTQSRGAFLAFTVVSTILFMKQKRRLRSFMTMAMLGVLVLAVAPKSVWDRFGGRR